MLNETVPKKEGIAESLTALQIHTKSYFIYI